jgi:hypothetical protein
MPHRKDIMQSRNIIIWFHVSKRMSHNRVQKVIPLSSVGVNSFFWVLLIQQNFVSLFWTFISKIDGFQFEHVLALNKKLEISFFMIMWIDFAWILVLYLFAKALNQFQSFVLIY